MRLMLALLLAVFLGLLPARLLADDCDPSAGLVCDPPIGSAVHSPVIFLPIVFGS